MQFGAVAKSERVQELAAMGYDFIELTADELKAEEPKAAFAPVRDRILGSGLRAEAFNKFIPGDMLLVGPAVDWARVESFTATCLGRMAELGGETMVWGSPHARNIPEGFAAAVAFEQLVRVGQLIANAARAAGVTVVIEPLVRTSTNTIHTLEDGLDLMRRIDRPEITVMADIFHMAGNGQAPEAIRVLRGVLGHVHVSDLDRRPPGSGEQDLPVYRRTFQTLREIGYDGRVSIETRWSDFGPEATRALQTLRETSR